MRSETLIFYCSTFVVSFPDMLDTYTLAMQDVEQYLGFLHSLSDMGAAMRKVITRAVTNPNIYTNLAECKYI